MSKIKLEIPDDANRLSVRLSLDMQAYCQATKTFLDKQTALKADPTSMQAKEELEKAEDAFHQERKGLVEQLIRLAGDLHWVQIKQLLAEQCNEDDPIENYLSEYLSNRYSDITPPLAIETLNFGFIELLKNSMDATLKNYLANQDSNTKLEMDISMAIQDDQIQVRIADNAGGFPKDYLDQLDEFLKEKAYLSATKPSGKALEENQYTFGGAGQGLPILYNKLLDGEELTGGGRSIKRYVVPEGQTAIAVNNTEKGAELILQSPVEPFRPVYSSAQRILSTLQRKETREKAGTPVSSISRGTDPGSPSSYEEEAVTEKPALFIDDEEDEKITERPSLALDTEDEEEVTERPGVLLDSEDEEDEYYSPPKPGGR